MSSSTRSSISGFDTFRLTPLESFLLLRTDMLAEALPSSFILCSIMCFVTFMDNTFSAVFSP